MVFLAPLPLFWGGSFVSFVFILMFTFGLFWLLLRGGK